MLNSNHEIRFDSATLDPENLRRTFDFNSGDALTRWVLRPLALLAALGTGAAVLIASTFLIIASLATLPLLAIGMMVVKYKLEKDQKAADPVVATQS